jgi:flagellar motor switch/type III secretory pathway protein FliN
MCNAQSSALLLSLPSHPSDWRLRANALIERGWIASRGWMFKFSFEAHALRFGRVCMSLNGNETSSDLLAFAIDEVPIDELRNASATETLQRLVKTYFSDAFLKINTHWLCNDFTVATDEAKRQDQYALVLSIQHAGACARVAIAPHLVDGIALDFGDETNPKPRSSRIDWLALTVSLSCDWSAVGVVDLQTWKAGDFLALSSLVEPAGKRAADWRLVLDKAILAQTRIVGSAIIVTSQRSFCSATSSHARSKTTNHQPYGERDMSNLQTSANENSISPDTLAVTSAAVDIPIPICIRIDSFSMTIKDLQSLCEGQVIESDTNTLSTVSVYASNTRIAVGTLCELNGYYGVLLSRVYLSDAAKADA